MSMVDAVKLIFVYRAKLMPLLNVTACQTTMYVVQ